MSRSRRGPLSDLDRQRVELYSLVQAQGITLVQGRTDEASAVAVIVERAGSRELLAELLAGVDPGRAGHPPPEVWQRLLEAALAETEAP